MTVVKLEQERTRNDVELKNSNTLRTKLPPSFLIDDSGLYFIKEVEAEKQDKIFICSHLEVKAKLRDFGQANWGRLLEFKDDDNHVHVWGMPMTLLSGTGEELRRELLHRGLAIGCSQIAKNKLLEYISFSKPILNARCVSRIGWHEGVFVLPNQTIGQSNEEIFFQTETPESQFKTKNSFSDWKNNIGVYCAGNSRLMLAVSTAFAAPLLNLINEESGGINLFGESSSGKTTALTVATSVYGESSYLSRWRATINGLEALAAMRNDCLLLLDEMAQIDPREAGNAIYTLANGAGKVRANQHGSSRLRNEWRILFLSSAEIDLNQHIGESGRNATAGQQVRCIDIPAYAGCNLGIFEDLHGFNSGAEFSDYLRRMSEKYYGSPLIEFLNQITKPEYLKKLPQQIKEAREQFIKNLPQNASSQVKRVGSRLALISFAGELATKLGITGWNEGEAMDAVNTCLDAWIEYRGGVGNQEKSSILSQLKRFIEEHGASRFEELSSTHRTIIDNRCGFRKREINPHKEDTHVYYLLPEALKEICRGNTIKTITNVLLEAGWLKPDHEGKTSTRISLPGLGRKRVYVFTDEVFADE